jgi:hypothetical protein
MSEAIAVDDVDLVAGYRPIPAKVEPATCAGGQWTHLFLVRDKCVPV